MKRKEYITALILLLIMNVVWIFVVPPFQIPDEQAHFRYIQFIVENKRIPDREDISDNDILESSSSITVMIEESQADRIFHNRNHHFDFDNPDSSNIDEFNAAHIFNHPPLYYLYGSIIYVMFSGLGIGTVFYAIRFGNVLFSILNFLYTYRISRVFSGNRLFNIFFTILVNFWPLLVFVNSGINNDVLVVTASIATLHYLLKLLGSSRIEKIDIFMLSLWVFIGCVTKASYLAFGPVLIAVLIYIFVRKFDFRKIIVFLIPQLFTVGYFILNLVVFGRLFPNPDGRTGIVGDNFFSFGDDCRGRSVFHYIWVLLSPRVGIVFKRFVGDFGWLDTALPSYIYVLAGILFLVGTLGFIWKMVMMRRTGKDFKGWFVIVGSLVMLELFMGLLFLRAYINSCYMGFPTQGRYYLPVIVPVLLIVSVGIGRFIPERFYGVYCKIGIVSILFFNFFCLAVLLQRYYL